MKSGLLNILLAVAFILAPISRIHANEDVSDRYRRSSLCQILVLHNEDKYADEIKAQFVDMQAPDKYNDHNLNVRVVSVSKKGKYQQDITDFIARNYIASRLVAKWFDRDILTGECNTDLLTSRAYLDANITDYELARESARGINSIVDAAADELINSTYLMMNEVTYVDKAKRSKTWGMIGGIAMGALLAVGGASASDISKTVQDVNDIISSYKGFSVKIHTRLYRLVWDDAAQAAFYECWTDAPDDQKRDLFEKNRDKFHMEYIGDVVSKGSKTSFLGINEEQPELMITKACTRAIDENIADLQKKYEQFRIKTPIISVEPTIQAQIGLKEGITKDSRFEVLEAEEKDGKITYKRVGVVKPVPNLIWDNRFMAKEELAYGADFEATTFVKESGGDLYPGLLLREITK